MNTQVTPKRISGELEGLLRGIAAIQHVSRKEIHPRGGGENLSPLTLLGFSLKIGGQQTWLIESNLLPLEPRTAEMAAIKVKKSIETGFADYGVIAAPYVSPRAAEILHREGVGYFDLSGNCLLACGPLFIERQGNPNKFARKAAVRSLFTPASERVLRALLDPSNQGESWTLRALAKAAYPGVSLGQVHKVRLKLGEQAFLKEGRAIQLREPSKLLGEWAGNYHFERNVAARYYSPLAPDELRTRFMDLATRRVSDSGRGVLASFSAAELLAPQVRQFRFFAYWIGDAKKLSKSLELKAVSSGDNIIIYSPYDEGVLYPATGLEVPVTAPVQTYLDLRASAARGEEAAEAVFEKFLKGVCGG